MKFVRCLCISLLASVGMLFSGDDERTQLFLSARVATDTNDVRTILNANFDTKFMTDNLLHEFLTKATAVVTLSAKNNMLQNPHPVASVYLTELNLSHGTLQSFPIGEFIVVMPQLKKIDLSHNQIVSIVSDNDVEPRNGCQNFIDPWKSYELEQINVSNNKLTEFDLQIIDNAPKMTQASFSDNPIADVKTPYNINYRRNCVILLRNTQLDAAKKQILFEKSIQSTEKYNNALFHGSLCGSAVLLITGMGTSLGISIGLHTQIIIPTLMLGGTLVGGLAGYGFGHCMMPKNKRTYTAFTFDFGESDSSINVNADYTQISMPLLQVNSNNLYDR